MKKRNILTILAAFAVIFGLVAATLAYFTDTDEAENVFTLGNIAVEIHEDNGLDPESEGYLENDEYREWLSEQTLLPGRANALPKNVKFTNTGANDSYIRGRILIPTAALDAADLELIYKAATNWNPAAVTTSSVTIDSVAYTQFSHVYPLLVPPSGETDVLMTGFFMASTIDQDDIAEIDASLWKILVQVDAIQADGFANATAAFTAFDAQMAP